MIAELAVVDALAQVTTALQSLGGAAEVMGEDNMPDGVAEQFCSAERSLIDLTVSLTAEIAYSGLPVRWPGDE